MTEKEAETKTATWAHFWAFNSNTAAPPPAPSLLARLSPSPASPLPVHPHSLFLSVCIFDFTTYLANGRGRFSSHPLFIASASKPTAIQAPNHTHKYIYFLYLGTSPLSVKKQILLSYCLSMLISQIHDHSHEWRMRREGDVPISQFDFVHFVLCVCVCIAQLSRVFFTAREGICQKNGYRYTHHSFTDPSLVPPLPRRPSQLSSIRFPALHPYLCGTTRLAFYSDLTSWGNILLGSALCSGMANDVTN